MNNPLLDFARKPELSIKLPSNCAWYDDGDIEYTLNGEVEVYPMLPKDELILMNPDSLLSGEANIQLIKSCVPAVKNPEKLLYPDANVLFLAIQKATYGDSLTMNIICPDCQKRAIALGDKEKIAEGEKKGDFILHSQEMEFSINEILQRITYLKPYYEVKIENGLTIYLRPNTLKDKMQYSLMSFNQEKIVKAYKEYSYEESIEDEEKRHAMSEVAKSYYKMNEIGNDLITSCIKEIRLPDDTFISDRDMIYEFVTNTKSSIITDLHDKIKEINDIGLPTTLNYRCSCCNYEWEEKFYGFNQVDFFGIGS